MKRETTQTGPKLRHEGENSILTVTGTGTAHEKRERDGMHAVESIGAGDGI